MDMQTNIKAIGLLFLLIVFENRSMGQNDLSASIGQYPVVLLMGTI